MDEALIVPSVKTLNGSSPPAKKAPIVPSVKRKKGSSPPAKKATIATATVAMKEALPTADEATIATATVAMKEASPTANGTTIMASALTVCGVDPENLSTTECQRVEQLKEAIDTCYEKIPRDLKHLPALQERCLEYLLDAERALIPPLKRKGIIHSRLGLTRVEMEIRRARISTRSCIVVALLVYLFALTIFLAFRYDILEVGVSGKEMNAKLIMGIPLPIMVWSFLGSMTSMLLRAGQLPFSNTAEALRWLLFRPIVGIVMGLLTYLMVTAGLLVFAGTSQTQTPELLWIIAFIGSFSDTLSINLLQNMVGTFQHVDAKGSPSESSSSQQAHLPKGAEQKDKPLRPAPLEEG